MLELKVSISCAVAALALLFFLVSDSVAQARAPEEVEPTYPAVVPPPPVERSSDSATSVPDECDSIDATPAPEEKPAAAPARARVYSPLAPPSLTRGHDEITRGFDWESAVKQTLLMLAVQHGYRLTEDKTRRFLPGPFFKDWFQSVKNLHGWDDKGSFFGNYIAHPMQGAVAGFIYVQNSPTARAMEFENTGAYWKSRAKAMGFSALTSAQFELGPLGQAAIGNVGLGPNHKKMAYVDLVITPTVGTAWLVMEDVVDRKVLRKLDERISNRAVRNLVRMGLNPMRACANLLRFKHLWYRDTR